MSLRDQNQALFEEASVPKALAAMAIPTIISQLITLIYNLADAFFVGRTGNPYMIAAVSLVFPVFAITVALSNLFGVGGGSLMSRCLGEGDEKSARQVSAFSLYEYAGLFDTSDAGVVGVHDFGFPAAPLSISEIHAQKILRKQGCLFASCAGSDF